MPRKGTIHIDGHPHELVHRSPCQIGGNQRPMRAAIATVWRRIARLIEHTEDTLKWQIIRSTGCELAPQSRAGEHDGACCGNMRSIVILHLAPHGTAMDAAPLAIHLRF